MSIFEEAYEKLNPQQKEAVDSIEGPVMVIAGPGTGKTQVLTLRIANILKLTDALPQNILALTFTDNATVNMRKRLIEFIGTAAYKVKINTFHSFCNDIITSNPEKFNFRSDLESLDDFGVFKLLRSIIDKFDYEDCYKEFKEKIEFPNKAYIPDPKLRIFSDPYFYQKDLISAINNLKREFVSPDKYKQIIFDEIRELNAIEKRFNPRTNKPTQKWANKLKEIEKNIELLGFYYNYQRLLEEEGKYDYNDMINFVVEAFEKQDDLLANYQEQYQYILVDEYQDTNGSQNRVVELLGSWDNSPNIFVVGDDDQSIYKFQGANLSNILEFKNHYPTAKLITITKNYRSTQQILDFAQDIISHNTTRLAVQLDSIDKNIKSAINSADGLKPNFCKFSREEIENYWIARKIKDLLDKGTPAPEIAVIYRKHTDIENLAETLQKLKIKVSIGINANLLEDVFINNVITLFKTVAEPTNDTFLSKVINFDFLNLRKLYTFKAIRYSNKNNIKLIDVMTNSSFLAQADIEDTAQLLKIGNLLLELQTLNINQTFLVFVQKLLRLCGVYDYLKKTKDYDKITNLNKLVNFIKKRNYQDRGYDLDKFLADIDIMERNQIKLTADSIEIRRDAINFMTAHSSKGLEFEYVFVPRFIEKNWSNAKNPSKLKVLSIKKDIDKERDTQLEEDRRLFFVAVTRAKKELYICVSDEYISGDLKTSKANASQLFTEIEKSNYNIIDTSNYEDNIEDILELSLEEPELYTFNKSERKYLQDLLSEFKLSPTSLNTYIKDPKEFLYKYVLKVAEIETRHMALGSSLHKTLEYFNRKLQSDKKIPELEELLNIFRSSMKNYLITQQDTIDCIREGERLLSDWYTTKAALISEPLYVEYSFNTKNLFLDDVPIEGKIDRIELNSDSTINIVDYKSGSAKYASQIVGPLKSKDSSYYRQMLFYQILCELDPNINYSINEIILEFLKPKDKSYKRVSLNFSYDEIAQMKLLIKEIMGKIRNLEF